MSDEIDLDIYKLNTDDYTFVTVSEECRKKLNSLKFGDEVEMSFGVPYPYDNLIFVKWIGNMMVLK